MKIATMVAEFDERRRAEQVRLTDGEKEAYASLLGQTAIAFESLIEGRRPVGPGGYLTIFEAIDMGRYDLDNGLSRIAVQPSKRSHTMKLDGPAWPDPVTRTEYGFEVVAIRPGLDLTTMRDHFYLGNSLFIARQSIEVESLPGLKESRNLTAFAELLGEVSAAAGIEASQLNLF